MRIRLITFVVLLLSFTAYADQDDIKDAYDQYKRVNESPYTHDFQKEWAERDLEREIDYHEFELLEQEAIDESERIRDKWKD